MRVLPFSSWCAAAALLVSCAEKPEPPAPAHPSVGGNIDSVSAADIRAAIVTMKAEFARTGAYFPIYRLHVTDRNHIDACFHHPATIEEGQGVARAKVTCH